MSTPEYLYLLVSPEVWRDNAGKEALALPEHHDAFIHLATEGQIPHIARKFYNDINFITLKIATEKMIGRLVYETNPGGTNKYYHLYEGVIPIDAIVEAIPSN